MLERTIFRPSSKGMARDCHEPCTDCKARRGDARCGAAKSCSNSRARRVSLLHVRSRAVSEIREARGVVSRDRSRHLLRTRLTTRAFSDDEPGRADVARRDIPHFNTSYVWRQRALYFARAW
jgi:hypothetical protein